MAPFTKNVLLAASLAATSVLAAPPSMTARSPSSSKGVIIQMFEWTWDSIAAECTNFIGPAGYGYVQVSPPAEHITGSQWWTDYQPVSHQIVSKRGNRDQFSNMVSTCHSAGVNVIADTIWNHMSASASGTGVGGSSYTQYNYPGLYQQQDFHSACSITNYDDATNVQTCQLDGLADLATETEYVRSSLANYANDLISLGVDGLRLDAAKHMNTDDIHNMLSRLSKVVYITQEVIYGAGEPITPGQYTQNGDVQEFRYTSALKGAFSAGGISGLQNIDSSWVPANQANVFVANHDTERGGDSLNSNSPSNTYVLATIFSLAHTYGTPTVLSSYSFSSTDDGAPNGGAGTCSGSGGSNGWLCQHRWTAFAGMVGWRNTVGNAGMDNWQSPQSSQVAWGRGNGFVAINNADSTWAATLTTNVPDGKYCDVIQGTNNGSGCSGATVTVSGGKFTFNINARDAVAFHTGQKA